MTTKPRRDQKSFHIKHHKNKKNEINLFILFCVCVLIISYAHLLAIKHSQHSPSTVTVQTTNSFFPQLYSAGFEPATTQSMLRGGNFGEVGAKNDSLHADLVQHAQARDPRLCGTSACCCCHGKRLGWVCVRFHGTFPRLSDHLDTLHNYKALSSHTAIAQ
jgi:hypothetical protein